MRSNLLLLVLLCLSAAISAQDNINLNLVSNVNYPEDCNDIWGYVADDGTEYAILGTVEATAILSLADPANPEEVIYIPGNTSLWRDMKAWGDFVYVTADAGNNGWLIIDMSGAPSNITYEYIKPTIMVNGSNVTIGDCHNIYIDENGYAYLSGCKQTNNNGGVLIFDVATTPGIPIFVGKGQDVYSHDNFTRGDTLWSADISAGYFSVQDVSVKNNSSTWTVQTTTTDFTHNCWLSDDGKYLFTTDERPNAFVDAYDVSDLNDVKRLDSYQPAVTAGNGVIPHNTHYEDGFLITSWYTDGIVVIDGSRPDNMIQVAQYDTYLGGDGGFSGCWGAYPFLPSGLILASDINSGLYVFEPEYQRACFLEGKVTDAADGSNIDGAVVGIQGIEETIKETDFMGDYKTGFANSGTYEVQFFKSGYLPKMEQVDLMNGVVTTLDVELTKAVPFNLNVELINAANGNPIDAGNVIFVSDFERFGVFTNASGVGVIPDMIEGDYEVFAGAWGFLHKVESYTVDPTTGTIQIALTVGYQDDFIFELGWTKENFGASAGDWERDEPIGTSFGSSSANVNEDIKGDLGEDCYVTDNRGGNAGLADVDNGTVILTSPVMDLTTYSEPIISYYTWFFNESGQTAPNDSLVVSITNGSVEEIIEIITDSEGAWREKSEFKVSNYFPLTDNVRIKFRTMDQPNFGNLVEAGVDAFLVTEGLNTSAETGVLTDVSLTASPNPFSNGFALEYEMTAGEKNAQVLIFNTIGQEVSATPINRNIGTLNLGADLGKGVYFVVIDADGDRSEVVKVVKE